MDYRVNKITFFVSYYEAFQCLENPEEKLAFINAFFRYVFHGEQPEFKDKLAGMFALIKPNIDKSIKNMEQGKANGLKGGAPIGNKNAEKKTTLGLNENKTDKDKEMDKDEGKGECENSDSKAGTSQNTNINFDKMYAGG